MWCFVWRWRCDLILCDGTSIKLEFRSSWELTLNVKVVGTLQVFTGTISLFYSVLLDWIGSKVEVWIKCNEMKWGHKRKIEFIYNADGFKWLPNFIWWKLMLSLVGNERRESHLGIEWMRGFSSWVLTSILELLDILIESGKR